MTMPRNLILVRHGESEGNLANLRSKEGSHTFPVGFKERHSSQWRLTKRGQEQAKSGGLWLQEHLPLSYRRLYTSTYYRARETAALLSLPDAMWSVDSHLRERDLGVMELLPHEREMKFPEEVARRKVDSFHWRPPGGESLTDLCVRLNLVLDRLHRKCADQNAIIVCHGEVIWMFRFMLERMTPDDYHIVHAQEHIHNCQIIHYSRTNPEDAEDVRASVKWMRSVCPWDESMSRSEWRPLPKRKYTNEDLLRDVSSIEPLIHK